MVENIYRVFNVFKRHLLVNAYVFSPLCITCVLHMYKNICINVCIIKIHVPRAHEVKNQRVIAKRTSQIMKYGQDVIIQKQTDDNIQ